jgi:hypothetical protein
MFVVCCVDRGFYNGLITLSEEPFRVFVCVCFCVIACDLGTSTMRRSRPEWGCCATKYTASVYSYEMWCYRMIEKFGWADRVKNTEALWRVKEERNILLAIKQKKVKLLCHVFCNKSLIRHVTEGKVKGTGRRGRRRKQLLQYCKEKTRPCNLKEEA